MPRGIHWQGGLARQVRRFDEPVRLCSRSYLLGKPKLKESWYLLAEPLQRMNIASLALDGKSRQDVLAAVNLLKGKGFKNILLAGGSMGGAAVLDALEIDYLLDSVGTGRLTFVPAHRRLCSLYALR